jgi:hypothetical protein
MSESLDYDYALQQCAEQNCEPIHFDSDKTNILMLDLDSPDDLQYYLASRKEVLYTLRTLEIHAISVEAYQSNSGLGVHVIIQLDCDLDITDAMMIQTSMGSDRKRDFLTLVRILGDRDTGHGPDPRMLFKPIGVTSTYTWAGVEALVRNTLDRQLSRDPASSLPKAIDLHEALSLATKIGANSSSWPESKKTRRRSK